MFNQKFLRKFIVASVAVGTLTFAPEIYGLPLGTAVVHAEIKQYVGVGESIVSDRETIEIGKQGARLQAIRNAQKQAGVFIGSYSVVKDHELDTDEVVAFTAGVVKVGNVSYEPVPVEQWVKYRATVTVTLDTDDLTAKINQWLGINAQDRSTITEQTKALNGTLDMIQTRTVELETAVAGATATVDSAKVQEELKQIDRDILYAQKISEGNELMRKGDRAGAMKSYQEAIALYPKDATLAYEKLGDSYLEAKDYARAIEAYTKVTQMDPNYVAPYNKRGQIYFELEEYRKAATDFEKAVKIAPTSVRACEYASWAHFLSGNYEAAIEYDSKANPNRVWSAVDPPTTIRRFKAYSDAIKKGTATANDYFERGYLYCNKLSYWIYHQYKLRFRRVAFEDYTKAIELGTLSAENLPRCFYSRAIIYLVMQEYGKALDDFKKGDQFVAELEDSYKSMSDRERKKRLADWLDNPYRCYCLGLCYEGLGRQKQAIENYKKALKAFNSRKRVEWPRFYFGGIPSEWSLAKSTRNDMTRTANYNYEIRERLSKLEQSK